MGLPEGLPELNKNTDWATFLRVTHTEELMRKTGQSDVGMPRTALPVAWWQNICQKLYERIQRLENRLDGVEGVDVKEPYQEPYEVESSVLEEGANSLQQSGLQVATKKRGRGRPRKIDPELEGLATEMMTSGNRGVSQVNTSSVENKSAELTSIVNQMLA